MNNTFKLKIHQLGKMVGLNKNDITQVLSDTVYEQISLSSGPSWYPGGRYGTISIKEFEK